jgi:hypothetical protein
MPEVESLETHGIPIAAPLLSSKCDTRLVTSAFSLTEFAVLLLLVDPIQSSYAGEKAGSVKLSDRTRTKERWEYFWS